MSSSPIQQHDFFCGHKSKGMAYFRIPKSMLERGGQLELSVDEIFLYAVLFDRTRLSCANGKHDADGRIFIFYTRKSAAKYMRWSERKATAVFQRLVDHSLLTEICQPGRTAKKLYLKLWEGSPFSPRPPDTIPAFCSYITALNIGMDTGNYYIIPKTLMEAECYQSLSLRAVLLYGIILDRLLLSQRYGRVDDDGVLWTTLDSEITQQELQCSPRTFARVYRELEDIGLIERKRTMVSQLWHIYARDYLEPPTLAEIAEMPKLPVGDANSAVPSCQICRSEMPNLLTNNNSRNNPSIKKLSMHQDIPDRNDTLVVTYNLLHYEETLALIGNHFPDEDIDSAFETLDMCVNIVESDLLSEQSCIMIGRNSIEKGQVISHYKRLNRFIMYIVIEKIVQNLRKIKNLNDYIHKTLYMAAEQHAHAAFYLERSFYEY